MPCDSRHLEPNAHERESVKVRGFLRELGIRPKGKDDVNYGNTAKLHEDTARLCRELQDMSAQMIREDCSLELQIWWRDHQKADEQRQAAERHQKQIKALREKALKKLTPKEREALGVKE